MSKLLHLVPYLKNAPLHKKNKNENKDCDRITAYDGNEELSSE